MIKIIKCFLMTPIYILLFSFSKMQPIHVFIGLRSSYKWLKFVYNWKGTIWHEKSSFCADIVTSRVFLSIEMILSPKSVYMKVVFLWVAFQCNLKHLIWMYVEEIMAKIQNLCQAQKLHPLDLAPLCRLGIGSNLLPLAFFWLFFTPMQL